VANGNAGDEGEGMQPGRKANPDVWTTVGRRKRNRQGNVTPGIKMKGVVGELVGTFSTCNKQGGEKLREFGKKRETVEKPADRRAWAIRGEREEGVALTGPGR